MAVDFDKVKRNIQRMIDGGASEAEIDEYVTSEGTTSEELRATAVKPPLAKGDRLDARPGPSTWESRARGAFSGAFLDWGDEAAAALAIDPFQGGWDKQYEQNVERIRGQQAAAQEANPVDFLGGQIGGGVATAMIPGMAPARGLAAGGRLLHAAKTGAGIGAAAGAGQANTGNPLELATGAGIGGLAGGLVGPMAQGGMDAVLAGGRAAGQGIAGLARGAVAPERQAMLDVTREMTRDAALAPPALTAADAGIAQQFNAPVMNIDRAGTGTRTLGRAAANISPQARQMLTEGVEDRFAQQNQRIEKLTKNIVGGLGTVANRVQLKAAASRANAPLYRTAMVRGDKPIITPELERLMGAPSVVAAMREAMEKGKDIAIAEGHGSFNPRFKITMDGRVVDIGGKGIPTFPNLQFWDYTRRMLQREAGKAIRAGDDSARELTAFYKAINQELDFMVPEYKAARGSAAGFFNKADALEAGEEFALSGRYRNDEVAEIVKKMSGPEKQLFMEGYSDGLIKRIMEPRSERDLMTLDALVSPAAMERHLIALGPERFKKMEALLRVEKIFNRSRDEIVKGPTTARQLAQTVMLTGGGGLGALGGNQALQGDWQGAGQAGLIAAALLGGRSAKFRVDRAVAEQVGRLLSSTDPQKIGMGLTLIARDEKIMNALRRATSTPLSVVMSRGAADQATPQRVYGGSPR